MNPKPEESSLLANVEPKYEHRILGATYLWNYEICIEPSTFPLALVSSYNENHSKRTFPHWKGTPLISSSLGYKLKFLL